MQLEVSEAPPPPVVDVTVDPTGTFDPRTGAATISGTITCTGGASEYTYVGTELRQQRGRFTVVAYGGLRLTCDATPRPWTIGLLSENGPFGQGDATNSAWATACGQSDCSSDYDERQVRLRNG
jgi:hypothetical protein